MADSSGGGREPESSVSCWSRTSGSAAAWLLVVGSHLTFSRRWRRWDPNQRASFVSSAESQRPRGLRRPEEDQLQQTGLSLSWSSLLPGFYKYQPSRRPATGGRPLLSEGPPRPSLEVGRGQQPWAFQSQTSSRCRASRTGDSVSEAPQ